MSEYKKNQILEAITAPLGFFVLALLIVETFLGAILVGSALPDDQKITGMYIGIGLFIFVTLIVSVFVWFKPDHLTFDKEAHLRSKGKPPFGTDSKFALSEESLTPGEPQE